ncbi:hypothetical protein KSP39_PZI012926 [Platanthera zijinensis]|uniref:Knottins-like domain-containing protein n=1 Tax=Platanthera zijinensis TaxID=2320716 RepID=A0AAP0G3T8_9ASPA
MELCKRMLPRAFVLFLLLISSGIVREMTAEAARPAGLPAGIGDEKRTCESQSHRFRGLCFSRSNCGHVCRTEGFVFGRCRGLRRRCFCTKHC